jgi:hypothetical protein
MNDQRSSLSVGMVLRLTAPCPRRRVLSRKTLTQQPRACQRYRVGILGHFVDAEPPLHEGNDPPEV